jgi:DNA polymerase III alpha subunit
MVLFKQYQNIILSNTITFSETPDISISFDNFHNQSADIWNFPKSYQQIDVKQWLLDKCKSPHEINRVEEEYILYANRDLIMLLRLFIFLVDYMRKNKFIWGIGRGSSVSSYILYLIGIHRVDSIRYNLHIEDYLK